jgi:alpha-L-arabinofuranosidase
MRRFAPVLLLPLLGACSTVSDVAALAAGGGAGAATANPALGFAVGVGVKAGVDELGKWYERSQARGEQDAIADAVGRAPPGTSEPWAVRHTIPIGNERGQFLVTREFATPLATCREVVFLVEEGRSARPFTTTVCRGGTGWRWASAEPAVDRWGYLQHQ